MGKPSSDSRSIVLQHCWVCEARFIGDGGTETREDHHIIPRAYGGVDGPTVTLCDSHHSKTHSIALKLIHNKPYFALLNGESKPRIQKLLYMANCIRNAELAMRNDPNKSAAAMVVLDARRKKMIDDLKTVYPNAKSREAILLVALEMLHGRHFIK